MAFSCYDCAGVPNGNTQYDECEICGGDNSTCAGCMNESASNFNSGAIVSCEFLDDFSTEEACCLSVYCLPYLYRIAVDSPKIGLYINLNDHA